MKYILRSDRIGFTTWNKEDLDIAYSLWGDEEVTKYIDSRGKLSYEQVKERLLNEIELNNKYNVQYWPIYNLTTNEFIGCCGLKPYKIDEGIYEIGFHIRKDYWGKGYAFEAATAVIDYAFNILKVDSLFAGHNPNNLGSKKILYKLGFTYTHDEYYQGTGLYHPSYILKK